MGILQADSWEEIRPTDPLVSSPGEKSVFEGEEDTPQIGQGPFRSVRSTAGKHSNPYRLLRPVKGMEDVED